MDYKKAMLFLVISTPRPERPSTVSAQRQAFWKWLAPKQKAKKALSTYARAGRGLVTVFDVRSHEELHAYLNEWAEIIPAHFEVLPLVDPAKAKKFLKKKR